MVGCAPTRESLAVTQFSCERRLTSQDCSTRLRVRVLPHNSRSSQVSDRPSPYEEVVINCILGVPIAIETDRLSSGRKLKAISGREYQDRQLVARARDKILVANERRRIWLLENRRTTVSTTSSTTTSPTSTSSTRNTSKRPTSTTVIPELEITKEYTDPTLEDSFSYDEYNNYYDYTNNEDDEEGTVAEDETDVPLSCSYTDWSVWTNCSSLCGSGTKSRTRALTHGSVQYCSYHNQTKSCYGSKCLGVGRSGRSMARATLLPGKYSQHGETETGYEVRSNLKNFTRQAVLPVYCVSYEVMAVSQLCSSVTMTTGQAVCGVCTTKAVMDSEQQCRGSGVLATTTTWRMFMEPICSGTWRMLHQMQGDCNCDQNSTFVFV
jgi:hypothetical protein